MSYKKGIELDGYFDYTVYPLEGAWDIKKDAKENFTGTINKDDLFFRLIIKQTAFVDLDFFNEVMTSTKEKTPHKSLDSIKFEAIDEGTCVQMLHFGSYDNEPETFRIMENFARNKGLKRISKIHKEIYLTDARKTPEKLKTVLRFQVRRLDK